MYFVYRTDWEVSFAMDEDDEDDLWDDFDSWKYSPQSRTVVWRAQLLAVFRAKKNWYVVVDKCVHYTVDFTPMHLQLYDSGDCIVYVYTLHTNTN